MALVIDLRPREKILIGNTVITNDEQRTRIHISGETAILREKDIMKEDDADTICKCIYFLVQCMYLSATPREYHLKYFTLVKEISAAAPAAVPYLVDISDHMVHGQYYKALKSCHKLIEFEAQLLQNITG